MTPFQLSAATQAAIDAALANGGTPGTNNINYLTAYNDIHADLVAQNAAGMMLSTPVCSRVVQPSWTGEHRSSIKPVKRALSYGVTPEAASISEGVTISTRPIYRRHRTQLR